MKRAINSKKWEIIAISLLLLILCCAAAIVIVIDPFLHYHKPLDGLEYPLNDERYINDGIARHYDYNAIITGTSTSQNFKTSQLEQLFGTKAIKQTYASGTYYEIAEGLNRAFSYNKEIDVVVWGLDLTRLNVEDATNGYEGTPEYLYDNNIFNDVSYVFNIEVLQRCINVINYTRSGQFTTTMDDYGSWYQWAEYGRERVLRVSLFEYEDFYEEMVLSDDDIRRITVNVTNNIIDTAQKHPDTTFYIFYSPASAVYWYGIGHSNQLNMVIDSEILATSLMLEQENIVLYGFADKTDITTNLDLYMDALHFSETVSEDIMQMIYDGDGRLTKDNYLDYYEYIRDFYSNYEYDYE